MTNLRYAKCGSDGGFLIETADHKTLECKGKLPLERILKRVLVTCTYCNNRWDHEPIDLSRYAYETSIANWFEAHAG